MEVHQIPLRMTNCHLIRDWGIVLVDGGLPAKSRRFLKTLSRLSIEPQEIPLILLAHGHGDYIGSTMITEAVCGPMALLEESLTSMVKVPSKGAFSRSFTFVPGVRPRLVR